MEMSTGTLDGKNPNPLIAKAKPSTRTEAFDSIRAKQEPGQAEDYFDFDDDMGKYMPLFLLLLCVCVNHMLS